MTESLPFQFLRPGWLLLIPLSWFVIWIFYKSYHNQSMWGKLCDPHLLKILAPKTNEVKSNNPLTLILAAVFTLASIAVAGPTWRSQPVPLLKPNTAKVVVLDLSRSMLAQDVQPTRFQRAVYKARDLITADHESQVALIAFAGAAFVVSPLTDDQQTVLNFLNSLRPDIMPVQGSRIDLAIKLAQKILTASLWSNSHIFILSDGVSHLQAAIEAAENADANGFKVSILAVGTAQGGPIKDQSGRLVRDQHGELIIAKTYLNDLKKITQAGNGQFVTMTPGNQDIIQLLSGFDVNEFDQLNNSQNQTLNLPVNDGIWLVWLVLPFALLLFRKNVFWILFVVMLAPLNEKAYALDWKSIWQNAEQRAYQKLQQGNYKDANELSTKPMLKGSAYYKAQDFKNAEQSFASEGSAQAHYNRGNALVHQQQFEQAIEAYGQALAMNPQFEDATHNKQLIEEFINQQQPEQDNQQNKEDQQEQSSDSSSQPQPQQSQPQTQSEADRKRQPEPRQPDEQDQQQYEQPIEQEKKDQQSPSDEQMAMQNRTDEQAESPESIDRWINRLPDDPSELLRKKFLRDYQRQRSQP